MSSCTEARNESSVSRAITFTTDTHTPFIFNGLYTDTEKGNTLPETHQQTLLPRSAFSHYLLVVGETLQAV